MSKNPFISIVIIHYNSVDLTKDCIESILLSSYHDYEIIVSDNASTDGSGDKIRKQYQNYPNIQVIKNKHNEFITGGYINGVKKAKGEKIIFMNNDIVVDRHWLEALIACSQDKKTLIQPTVLSFHNKNIIDNAGGRLNFLGFGFGRGGGELSRKHEQNEVIDFVVGTIFMIDKEFYNEIGGLDPWYKTHYEDVDLSLRAKKHGGRCIVCGQSKVYHKGSETYKKSRYSKILQFHIRKNRIRTVQKNYEGLEKDIKLFLLLIIYCLFILKDMVTLQFTKAKVTLDAISTAFTP